MTTCECKDMHLRCEQPARCRVLTLCRQQRHMFTAEVCERHFAMLSRGAAGCAHCAVLGIVCAVEILEVA